MNFIKTKFEGLTIIEPKVFSDVRGCFLETYNKELFNENIGQVSFVQDNESKSFKGVLRGLHFQKPPYDQAKLVRCIKGKILDVAVDLRKKSNTYGKHFTIELSEKNKKQLFIPRGFAHGFLVLSNAAIFSYKVDNKYAPDYDAGILWDDPVLKIQWGINKEEVLISEKDSKLPLFSKFESCFL